MSLTKVSETINQRRFTAGLRAALRHVIQNKDNAHAWFAVALAANLTDQPEMAKEAYEHAKQCPNFTAKMNGDFHRDFMLRAIRQRLWTEVEYHWGQVYLLHVEPFIALLGPAAENKELLELGAPENAPLYKQHPEYANVFAVALGAYGRWHEAIGDFGTAVAYHRMADTIWDYLGKEAEHQWRYNNVLHLLLAIIQLGGEPPSPAVTVSNLYARLVHEAPKKAKPRVREANIMRIPKFGPRLFHITNQYLPRLKRLIW